MSTTHARPAAPPVLGVGRRIHPLVAGLSLTYGIAGMVVQPDRSLWDSLGFPFVLWGAALAAATAAYYYRRHTACSTCMTGGPR